MKNKLFRDKSYARLIRKMFWQTLAIMAVAVLAVLLLRSAGRGYFGNAITVMISRLFHIGWERAVNVYQFYVRNNIDTIMLVTIVIFFIILFRFSLSRFTRYFDQIVSGVDQLAEESGGPIAMSPELGFMERKLNQVRERLAARAEKAREAEARKNDLVVYLAHDIKTPLTSVIGYLSLLAENPAMPEKQKADYIGLTLDKANRLETLVNEFFEITRYNLQTVPLKKEKIDLYYMLVQMADEAFPLLSARGKKVSIEAPEDMTVYADPDKLARVFNNILKNAIHYSDESPAVIIRAEAKDGQSLISFENGGAIPQDRLDKIFEKFYRLDGARSTATGGSGLGLAIAKDIVDLHGGTITAESGDGSTVFTVALPAPPREQKPGTVS